MELADPEVLRNLAARTEPVRNRISNPRMTRRRADALQAYQAPVAKTRAFRCRCGICAHCAENVRWERIFKEKFADPEYYSRTSIRCESSLNNW